MRGTRVGFTLVELLVVITIILLLMGMLFPAVRSVIENARQSSCRANLTEMGKACKSYIAQYKSYPSGGWGARWAGDPERGFGLKQGSGWMYSLLPFIGESELHDLGKGGTDVERRATGAIRVQKAIPMYSCPSRRRPDLAPITSANTYINIDQPLGVGRNDYAANGGDLPYTGWETSSTPWAGPATIAEADGLSENDWRAKTTGKLDPNDASKTAYLPANGVVYIRSGVTQTEDGEVCTIMAAEKYLNTTEGDSDITQGWDAGYGPAVNRWTRDVPYEDGPTTRLTVFGSAHSNGVNTLFCDGHVSVVSYFVDAELFRQVGNRKDGTPTDMTKVE